MAIIGMWEPSHQPAGCQGCFRKQRAPLQSARLARMPMMAMTTNNSIKVKAGTCSVRQVRLNLVFFMESYWVGMDFQTTPGKKSKTPQFISGTALD